MFLYKVPVSGMSVAKFPKRLNLTLGQGFRDFATLIPETARLRQGFRDFATLIPETARLRQGFREFRYAHSRNSPMKQPDANFNT
jgi:hypothetical protein